MGDRESTISIVSGIQNGEKRLAAKLMSMIENNDPEGEACLMALRRGPGRAHIIGVTGWPGVGKSTLISGIARHFLNENRQVGIIAVDPTSPLSGGSLLGDRQRMRGIDGDERLFIRSMATRGYPGGIAGATDAFICVMEAMGKEVVIVETVGVGQDQVSVTDVADTIVMTVIPGMGDYLQALKAGIMELGDIFVVNKADRKGIEEVVVDLKMILSMSERAKSAWKPPIIKTVAVEHKGIEELVVEVERHRDHLIEGGRFSSKRLKAARLEIIERLKVRFFDLINERVDFEGKLDYYAREILEGKIDRQTLVADIFRNAGMVK